MSGFEYRLRWMRVGRLGTSQIMQTEKGAVEKAQRMLRLDEDKKAEEIFMHMPDLVVMSLERRAVGPWETVRVFEVPEPDDEWGAFDEDPNAGIEVPW